MWSCWNGPLCGHSIQQNTTSHVGSWWHGIWDFYPHLCESSSPASILLHWTVLQTHKFSLIVPSLVQPQSYIMEPFHPLFRMYPPGVPNQSAPFLQHDTPRICYQSSILITHSFPISLWNRMWSPETSAAKALSTWSQHDSPFSPIHWHFTYD